MSILKKEVDFVGKRKIFLIISLSIMVIGLIFNIVFGVDMDITFKGGTLIKYSYEGELNRETVERFVEDTIGKTAEVQVTKSSAGDDVVNISMLESLTMEEQQKLDTAIDKQFSVNKLQKLSFNTLKPNMGTMFFLKCLVAIALASLFLVIYVAIRFRKIGGWSAGVMGLVALVHDILIAYFAFVILRIPLDDNFVAVVLSILGFSLNDTIVIYDRIRENRRVMSKETPIGVVVNKSINQSFARSFNTGFCTFLAIATVAVLAVAYGLDSIISFAVPMMFGIISGCYSTICICGPFWVKWQEAKEKKELSKKRA